METNAIMSNENEREKFIAFVQEDANSTNEITDIYSPMAGYYDVISAELEKKEQGNALLMRMHSLFGSESNFEMICRKRSNGFLDSRFKEYFLNLLCDEMDEEISNDLKYVINICGFNLKNLCINGCSCSELMPLIKSNCSNLENLTLTFEETESQYFEDVFSNMSQLESLTINWYCKDSTLPMTLIKSIEQVRETLKSLSIICDPKKCYPLDSPDSSVQVFSPENETLIVIVIGNMKNLEYLKITLDHSVTDNLLINLANNSKNLKDLYVSGSNITDKGITALNNLTKLSSFSLGLNERKNENKFITDQSIKCLMNKELQSLDLSYCSNICSDSSIIDLITKLPSLTRLYLENTQVTLQHVEEACNFTEPRKKYLNIFVSFKVPEDYKFKTKSNITFSTLSTINI